MSPKISSHLIDRPHEPQPCNLTKPVRRSLCLSPWALCTQGVNLQKACICGDCWVSSCTPCTRLNIPCAKCMNSPRIPVSTVLAVSYYVHRLFGIRIWLSLDRLSNDWSTPWRVLLHSPFTSKFSCTAPVTRRDCIVLQQRLVKMHDHFESFREVFRSRSQFGTWDIFPKFAGAFRRVPRNNWVSQIFFDRMLWSPAGWQ